MLEKIVFLCVNPWEGFRSPIFQSGGREYFHWVCKQAILRNLKLVSRELMEVYGELQREEELFFKTENEIQLLYVQSHRIKILEAVFEQADLVLMGVPGCLKDFEKIFMCIFPWKEQVLFLWEQYLCRDENFLQQLCTQYKIQESQMIELERNLKGELFARR